VSRRRVRSSTIEEASKSSRVIEESKPEIVNEEKPQAIEEEEEKESESQGETGGESESSLSGEIVEIHEAAASIPLVKLFSIVKSGSYSIDGEYLIIKPEHDGPIELLKIPLRELNSTVNVLIKARAGSIGELKKLKSMLQLEKLRVRVVTEVEV